MRLSMRAGQGQPRRRPISAFIGSQERQALLSIAIRAATAAGDGITAEARHYAECAVRLLKAAIGEPITLAQAQNLLERWALLGTPLEAAISDAIVAIKTRRQVLGDESFGQGAS
jgi:hypothetical protein